MSSDTGYVSLFNAIEGYALISSFPGQSLSRNFRSDRLTDSGIDSSARFFNPHISLHLQPPHHRIRRQTHQRIRSQIDSLAEFERE